MLRCCGGAMLLFSFVPCRVVLFGVILLSCGIFRFIRVIR